MARTGPPSRIVKDEDNVDLRAHYGMVAQDALRLLWQRKRLIAVSVVLALLVCIIALAQMAPRYTGEALIQVDLNLNPDTSTKSPPTASVSAAEVVDSTARIIRSRATADAVVARLGLDKDRRFEDQPLLPRSLSAVRSALGLQRTTLMSRGVAVDALMRQMRVTAEPRSYLVAVAASADDPRTAAKLANAIAVEYLRTHALKGLAEERSAVENELMDASSVYGPRHPTYLRASTRLEQLDTRIAALRDAATTEDLIRLTARHSLIAAQPVMKPSSPNIPLILTLALLVGLSVGLCLARYTAVGPVEQALATALRIVVAAAYAVPDGILTGAKAGWARRSAFGVRLFRRAGRDRVGLALRRSGWRRIAPTIERAKELAIGWISRTRPSSQLRRGFPRVRTCGKLPRVVDLTPLRNRTGWRPLPGAVLCLATAGFVAVPGDAFSSLVDQIVQRIPAFQMPDLSPWVGPARDRGSADVPVDRRSAPLEPRAENVVPPAANGAPHRDDSVATPGEVEPRAENSIPPAAYSVAETPGIPPAAKRVSPPRPVQAAPPAAAAPTAQTPDPGTIAPTAAVPPPPERTPAAR
jgi:capsular polysaccharide biosynthesis protein